MAVLKRQLDPDEDVLVETIPHWIFLAKPASVTALTLAVAVVASVYLPLNGWLGWVPVVVVAVPALWLAIYLVRWRTTSLVVTSNRLIVRRGALSRQAMQVRLNRVNEVGFQQSFFERLLGTGQLLVETGGEDGVQVFPYARKPAVLQRIINHQLDVAQGTFRPAAPGVAGPTGTGPGPSNGGYGTPGHVAAGRSDAWPLVGPDAPTDPGQRLAPGMAPPSAAVGGWPSAPVPGGLPVPPPSSVQPDPAVPSGQSFGGPAAPSGQSFGGPAVPSGQSFGGPAVPSGQSFGGPAAPTGPVPSIPDQIVQLDQLRQRGLLNEAEFQVKKKELLDRM